MRTDPNPPMVAAFQITPLPVTAAGHIDPAPKERRFVPPAGAGVGSWPRLTSATPRALPERAQAESGPGKGIAGGPVWALWVWALGVLLLGARRVWQSVGFARRLKQRCHPADAAIHAALGYGRRALGVRRPLGVWETDQVKSPALYGLFPTRVLIPEGLARSFSAAELRFVLLHELAHVQRRDMVENWLVSALDILHWFNPLVWVGFVRMRADRELACDALVLAAAPREDHRRYGLTIIKVLEQFARPAPLPGLVGLMEDKTQMKRRIQMIAHYIPAPRWSAPAAALFVGLGLMTLTDGKTGGVADPSPGILPAGAHVVAAAQNRPADPAASAAKESPLAEQTPPVTRTAGPGVAAAAAALIQDGKALYEQGQLGEAEVKFQEALKQQPAPPDAAHYLRLISVKRKVAANRRAAPAEGVGEGAKLAENPKFLSKVFRVDPNSFVQGLESVAGPGNLKPEAGVAIPDGDINGVLPIADPGRLRPEARGRETIQEYVRRFFTVATGVDFGKAAGEGDGKEPTPNEPGNPKRAMFFNDRTGVLFVRALPSELDTVELAVQVLNLAPAQINIEAKLIEITQTDSQGLGFNVLGNWPMSGGAVPPPDISTAINPSGVFPGPGASGVANPSGVWPGAGTTGGPAPRGSLTGILSDAQYRTLQNILAERDGVRVVLAPNVTTLSARQAQIVMDAQDPEYILNVLPVVAPDDYTIKMSLDFSYWKKPGAAAGAAKVVARKPLVHVSTEVSVWDGQTVVLGGFVDQDVTTEGGQETVTKKNLVLFVTAKIIDPAGNRVHADDQRPSGTLNTVPPQAER